METREISQNANIFIKLIKTGKLPKEILPNHSQDYTFNQEKHDTEYYLHDFLNSSSYDYIKESEGVSYNGE